MATNAAGKRFDCVKFTREQRKRIAAETAGMNFEQLRAWLESRRYSSPVLQRLANLPPGRGTGAAIDERLELPLRVWPPADIYFRVRQDAADGGYTARAPGFGLCTEGTSLDAIRCNVRAVVRGHFTDPERRPRMIHLCVECDEALPV